MKIKANQSFYKNVLIVFAVLSVFIESLAYFLGFSINAESLCFYFLFIGFTIGISFILFLFVDKINNKYIIFDKEKIVKRDSRSEKIIVYYNQIQNIKYYNRIDLFRGIIDFGYADIVYKVDIKEKEFRHISIYLSKKHYDKFLMIKRNSLQ